MQRHWKPENANGIDVSPSRGKFPGPCVRVGSIPTSGINDFKGLAK